MPFFSPPSPSLGLRIFLASRAYAVALQACWYPETARAARAWLRLAARRANRLRLFSLSNRIAALEHGILSVRQTGKGDI